MTVQSGPQPDITWKLKTLRNPDQDIFSDGAAPAHDAFGCESDEGDSCDSSKGQYKCDFSSRRERENPFSIA